MSGSSDHTVIDLGELRYFKVGPYIYYLTIYKLITFNRWSMETGGSDMVVVVGVARVVHVLRHGLSRCTDRPLRKIRDCHLEVIPHIHRGELQHSDNLNPGMYITL